MEVIFRQIEKADAAGIQAVALKAWQHTYREIFDQAFIENFVRQNYNPEALISLLPRIRSGEIFFEIAESNAQLVGFCQIGLTTQGAQLFRIYVLPSSIGKGLGRRFLQSGETFVLSHGLGGYFCFVHKDNEIGKSFYLRNQFRHISDRDKGDEWFMEKILPGWTEQKPE